MPYKIKFHINNMKKKKMINNLNKNYAKFLPNKTYKQKIWKIINRS